MEYKVMSESTVVSQTLLEQWIHVYMHNDSCETPQCHEDIDFTLDGMNPVDEHIDRQAVIQYLNGSGDWNYQDTE
jgi:hypothetical protein